MADFARAYVVNFRSCGGRRRVGTRHISRVPPSLPDGGLFCCLKRNTRRNETS